MKSKLFRSFLALGFLALSTLDFQLSRAQAQGTAFTYQGQLQNNGSPANGSYDLVIVLYDASFGGSQVGPILTNAATAVSNGSFTVPLNFGAGIFTGGNYWLDISVRTNRTGAFNELSPRQPLTPAPYAIFANTASNLSGTVSAAQLSSGTIPNSVLPGFQGSYSTVGGGQGNAIADGTRWATIAGGNNNTNNGNAGTIGGGQNNTVTNGYQPTVGGGYGNFVSNSYATVGGGYGNFAAGEFSTVGGGEDNTATGESSTVSGGGFGNQASGDYSSVGGGYGNQAGGASSTVSGGGGGGYGFNSASGNFSTVGGGAPNIASGDFSTVSGGGGFNTASGDFSTVPGGAENTAAGAYSFAAGDSAQATNDGAFVWADSQGYVFASTSSNQFLIRAQGGVGINTTRPQQSLSVVGGLNIDQGSANNGYLDQNGLGGAGLSFGSLSGEGIASQRTAGPNQYDLVLYTGYAPRITILAASGNGYVGIGRTNPVYPLQMGSGAYCSTAGVWTSVSDRNVKEGFTSIRPAEVLAKVVAMPITQWKYKVERNGIKHLGPMAQDFYSGFGLGDNDKAIGTVDEGGVALAAIQGLNEKLNEKDAEIQKLKEKTDKVDSLEKQNESLAARLNELEATVKALAERNEAVLSR